MIIERADVECFGKFKKVHFDFTEGVNVIEGENEAGKSTVAEFIRFVFYGLSEKEYSKAEEGEETAEGSLVISCEKGHFRIDRKAVGSRKNAGEDTVSIVDLQLGAPIKGKDPAALFLGVSEEIFERSCFMSQLDKREVAAVHLERAVKNMLSSSSEAINAEKSAELLTGEEGFLESEEEGSLKWQKRLLSDLSKRKEQALRDEENHAKIADMLAENRKKTEGNKKESEECLKRLRHADALGKLDRLRRAVQAEKELKQAENDYNSAKDALSCGAFLPDKAYVKNLMQIQTDVLSLKKLLQNTEEELKDSEQKLESLPLPAGGKEGELLVVLQEYARRRSSFRNYSGVSGIAATLMALLTLLFSLLRLPVGAILCGIGGIAGVAGVLIFLRKYRKTVQEENDLYLSVGAENKADIAKAVERNAGLIAQREMLQKKFIEGEQKSAELKEQREALLARAGTLAGQWGKTCRNSEELTFLCSKAERAYEELSRLSGALKQAQAAFSTLEISTTEEELKQILELLRTDGIQEELSPEDYKALKTKVNFYTQTCKALDARIVTQEQQLRDLERTMEDVYAIEEEMEKVGAECRRLERRLTVVKAARDAMLESVRYMRGKILPGIMEDASVFFEKATVGKYTALIADADFSVSAVDCNGKKVPMSALSGAMKELCYMALRMSMTGKLYGGIMPVILDESFSSLDDLHLAAAFTAVSEHAAAGKSQIILMTCRKRETALLEKIGPVHKILL